MKVIGITGFKRSGKNEAALAIAKSVGALQSVAIYNFADPIYNMLVALLGDDTPLQEDNQFDKTKVIEKYGCDLRHMLRTLGTGWGRKMINENIWVTKARDYYEHAKRSGVDYLVYADVRFDNEANMVREMGGPIIRIKRPGVKSDGDETELGIPDRMIEVDIWNDRTVDDLQHSISEWMAMYGYPV